MRSDLFRLLKSTLNLSLDQAEFLGKYQKFLSLEFLIQITLQDAERKGKR